MLVEILVRQHWRFFAGDHGFLSSLILVGTVLYYLLLPLSIDLLCSYLQLVLVLVAAIACYLLSILLNEYSPFLEHLPLHVFYSTSNVTSLSQRHGAGSDYL